MHSAPVQGMKTIFPIAPIYAAWPPLNMPHIYGNNTLMPRFISTTLISETPGRKYENFYAKLKQDENVFFVKGKVAEVAEEAGSGNITLVAEDTISGEKIRQTVDMLVLATGMQPNASVDKPNADLKFNSDGFIVNDFKKGGMFAAGCANKPADVVTSNQNATGMALKAIQTLVRR